ncbi:MULTISPECIES: hypothetical protein [Actinomadura]|uniref:Helix-turn-helix domain-containing protein n=1 Tax=Actinomadura yumaensis TaxID=111807 RepID=A0ABW2CLE0_9ACTN|nr:hypothetical protein [Actinomadura sp. J1-007]
MIVAEFIASCRTEHGIPHAIACRALQVSQSWFYKQVNRVPTIRERRRAPAGGGDRAAVHGLGRHLRVPADQP